MFEKLDPQEQELLQALYHAHREHASLYLDLLSAFPDYHAYELRGLVDALRQRHFLTPLHFHTEEHLLCRISQKGIDALRQRDSFSKYKKALVYAGFFCLVLLLGLSMIHSLPFNTNSLKGDVSGIEPSSKARANLSNWIEGQGGVDCYTFSLLRVLGEKRTYLVECKEGRIDDCKYDIVSVEVNEKTGYITHVEVPYS